MSEIIRAARGSNDEDRLTGALIFDGACFCQYLEGPSVAVTRKLLSIEADPRHSSLRILVYDQAETRRFAEWSMAFVLAAAPTLIPSIGQAPPAGVADAFTAALAQCEMRG